MKESESVSCSVMSESAISWTAAARLLCPWNSPCKNTGVGPMPFFWGSSWPGDWTQVPCIAGRFFTIWASREALHKHSLCVLSRSVMSDSLQQHGLQPGRLLCPWDSPGKNTGVGCHALLQGIFLTQGLNQSFLHCRGILYQLSYQGSLHRHCRY